MENDFDYSLVPAGYAFCMNARCSQASECLLHQLYLHVPHHVKYIRVVNPLQSVLTGENACPYFKADVPVRFAVGMKHLFDTVPHKDALVLRDQLMGHFGHNLYYRYWREERMFSPAEQEYVAKLFRNRGITAPPVFDAYVERYDW
ncbi:DUF6078 family protein [Phocaeicola sp.]